jgi:hypothetical protein
VIIIRFDSVTADLSCIREKTMCRLAVWYWWDIVRATHHGLDWTRVKVSSWNAWSGSEMKIMCRTRGDPRQCPKKPTFYHELGRCCRLWCPLGFSFLFFLLGFLIALIYATNQIEFRSAGQWPSHEDKWLLALYLNMLVFSISLSIVCHWLMRWRDKKVRQLFYLI